MKAIKLNRIPAFAGMAMMMIFLAIGQAWGTNEVKFRYARPDGESGYDVRLVRTQDAWADGIVGVWDGDDEGTYAFTVDLDDTTEFTGTTTYKIMENEAVVYDLVMFGDIRAHEIISAHQDSSAAHGVAGDVVGTSDTQTLTNKEIDGDDNLVQDLAGSALKDNADLPPVSVRPDDGEDVYLHMNTGDADGVTVQVSNDAKSVDEDLTVMCDTLRLADDGGSDICVLGVAWSEQDNAAVPRASLDSVITTLNTLTRSDAFTGTPAIQFVIARRSPREVVAMSCYMQANANRDAVNRYEVYYSYRLLELPTGTDDQKLDYLRDNANRLIFRYGEPSYATISTRDAVWAYAVAWDCDSPADVVFSSRGYVSSLGDADNPGRDAADNILVLRQPFFVGACDNEAYQNVDSTCHEYIEHLNAGATPKLVYRTPYYYDDSHQVLQLRFFGKTGADSDDNAYIKIEIYTAAGVSQLQQTYLLGYSVSYTTTPLLLQLDVSDGLDDGVLYDARVYFWSDAVHNTYVKMIRIDGEAEVEIY